MHVCIFNCTINLSACCVEFYRKCISCSGKRTSWGFTETVWVRGTYSQGWQTATPQPVLQGVFICLIEVLSKFERWVSRNNVLFLSSLGVGRTCMWSRVGHSSMLCWDTQMGVVPSLLYRLQSGSGSGQEDPFTPPFPGWGWDF